MLLNYVGEGYVSSRCNEHRREISLLVHMVHRIKEREKEKKRGKKERKRRKERKRETQSEVQI